MHITFESSVRRWTSLCSKAKRYSLLFEQRIPSVVHSRGANPPCTIPQRLGGRTYSIPVGTKGRVLDVGGSWVHEHTNNSNTPTFKRAKELGLLLYDYPADGSEPVCDAPPEREDDDSPYLIFDPEGNKSILFKHKQASSLPPFLVHDHVCKCKHR